MPSLGIAEILLIGIVLLLVVGPDRLPHATRGLGRLYGRARRAADELRRALVLEADRLDEEDRLKDLKKRRADELERRRVAAEEEGGGFAQPEAGDVAEDDPEDELPPGFTEQEWHELPDHIKAIIRRRNER